jgi:hypothetical protein
MFSLWLAGAMVLLTPPSAPVPTLVVPLGEPPSVSQADVVAILGRNDGGGGSFASEAWYYSELHLGMGWSGHPDRSGLRLADVSWSCAVFGVRIEWD